MCAVLMYNVIRGVFKCKGIRNNTVAIRAVRLIEISIPIPIPEIIKIESNRDSLILNNQNRIELLITKLQIIGI